MYTQEKIIKDLKSLELTNTIDSYNLVDNTVNTNNVIYLNR